MKYNKMKSRKKLWHKNIPLFIDGKVNSVLKKIAREIRIEERAAERIFNPGLAVI